MSDNSSLHIAKRNQDDEFYTLRETVEDELMHYHDDLRGKSILCNCDDPITSEFVKYFVRQFDHLGLKKLVATHYDPNEENPSYFITYFNDMNDDGVIDFSDAHQQQLRSNGDFRSADCLKLLDDCDVVVTNPPFSLFREYLATLVEHGKQFLIIANDNAITYKEVFPLLKDNKVWLGFHHGHTNFGVPDGYVLPKKYEGATRQKLRSNGYILDDDGKLIYRNLGNICWFTNLPSARHAGHVDVEGNYYDEQRFPRYVNCDAIEVSQVNNIPCDYDGVMGVPVSIFHKYDPDQFEVIGFSREIATPIRQVAAEDDEYQQGGNACYLRVGEHKLKRLYGRVLIKHKRPDKRGDA